MKLLIKLKWMIDDSAARNALKGSPISFEEVGSWVMIKEMERSSILQLVSSIVSLVHMKLSKSSVVGTSTS